MECVLLPGLVNPLVLASSPWADDYCMYMYSDHIWCMCSACMVIELTPE